MKLLIWLVSYPAEFASIKRKQGKIVTFIKSQIPSPKIQEGYKSGSWFLKIGI